jgi:hypothetical protein
MATASRVHNGQTRCLMRVEFAPGFIKGFIHAAACGRGTHNLFNRNLRRPSVLGYHAMTQAAFGHDAYQATALFVSLGVQHESVPTGSILSLQQLI